VESGRRAFIRPRWAPLAATILRSVERGKAITSSFQSGGATGAPLETIVGQCDHLRGGSLSAAGAPPIHFVRRLESGIELQRTGRGTCFLNLFTNARLAMPEGGAMKWKRGRLRPHRIVVTRRGAGSRPNCWTIFFDLRFHARHRRAGFAHRGTIVKQDDGRVCA